MSIDNKFSPPPHSFVAQPISLLLLMMMMIHIHPNLDKSNMMMPTLKNEKDRCIVHDSSVQRKRAKWKHGRQHARTTQLLCTKIAAHGFMQLDVNLLAGYESGDNFLEHSPSTSFRLPFYYRRPKSLSLSPKEDQLLHVIYSNPNCITWASVCVCVCVFIKVFFILLQYHGGDRTDWIVQDQPLLICHHFHCSC